ncbi:MAG: hypothetical protein ACR2OD_11715 [Gaiellaceae bacterium]
MSVLFPDDDNPWDWANRARIGAFASGLIGAGVAFLTARSDGALVAGIVAAFVVVGAVVGAWLPYRMR